MTTANDVLEFWFAPESRPDQYHPDGRDLKAWFAPDRAFDDTIREQFLDTLESAARGDLDGWMNSPEGALALVVVLDQFPRNMFRGQPRAFATDGRAMAVAEEAIARGFDQRMPGVWRKFFYLPFEHAEDREAQARSVALFRTVNDPTGQHYAELHREIIDRFGRFPHRNAILGRESTPEEAAWLAGGGETFGTKG
ncbi:DUF924 family protein [Emcibacter sp. SYSU 3D8]|uniref:DUF924 family protein n=1 Tax=Emcibacter sp. SYSU 3D8 TaxID=3133969 RepID=UPI0031FF066B